MACGCKNKKKRNRPNQPSVRYTTNGNPTEAMGLNQFINLPVRLPRAIDGKDVVIAANRKTVPPVMDAMIIIGRNAKIEKAHKKQLMEKWPQAFNA
jgi:hypothetical protein